MDETMLAELSAMMVRYGIAELEIREGHLDIRLGRAAEPQAAPPAVSKSLVITAPAIGLFDPVGPWADALPEGQKVRKGEIVAWLKAGSVYRAVTAPDDGHLGPACVPAGALIGYGTRLY